MNVLSDDYAAGHAEGVDTGWQQGYLHAYAELAALVAGGGSAPVMLTATERAGIRKAMEHAQANLAQLRKGGDQ